MESARDVRLGHLRNRRHYGHLACDGREHAVALLDALAAHDKAWTYGGRRDDGRKLIEECLSRCFGEAL